jgi:hypothetical protein
MLDYLYHGKYNLGTDDAPTKVDVLTHLFCYAIGESYMIKSMSAHALAGFDEALRAITPKEFAELVGVIASSTDAMPVHSSIRNVAFHRLDELAESKSFVNIMSGKHLSVTIEQKDADSGETAYRNLQAAIQLATLSAHMFRLANITKTRTASENARLSRRLEDTQRTVEEFKKQVITSTTSLHKSQSVHGSATEAIEAAQKEAHKAKKELLKVASHSYQMSQDLKSTNSKLAEVEEQVLSVTQALEKAELELEILQNEDRNNGRAMEKFSKSTAAADLSLKQREQQLAPSLSRTQAEEVKHLVNTAKGQQRKACQVQVEAEEKEKKAAQEQEKYKNLRSQLQGKYEQTRRQLEEANKEVHRLLAENKTSRKQDKGDSAATLNQTFEQQREITTPQIQDELLQVKRELAEATKVTQRVLAENQVLREKAKEHSAASFDQSIEQQKELAVLQIQSELAHAKHELAQVNQETQRLMVEAKALRGQCKEDYALAQQTTALYHHTQHLHTVQAELNRANLDNFIMQRRIVDLENIIVNGTAGGQAALGF